MAAWKFLIYALFPVPLTCLVLLSFPFPDSIATWLRKMILRMVDKILFTSFISKLNLYQFSTLLSVGLFLMSINDTVKAHNTYNEMRSTVRADVARGEKWRSERNFWISFMSLVLWLVLHRVYRMSQQIAVLRDEIKHRDSRPKND